jgi:hypothetical protein
MQWFVELMIHSTCFGQYYAHFQELETIQMVTACGTKHCKGGETDISGGRYENYR